MSAAVATLERPVRRFRFGVTVLEDLDPSKSPQDVLRLYIPNYPFLAHAVLGEPALEDGALVYPVQKPAVQTKGARSAASKRAVADAISSIRAWAGEEPEVKVSDEWNAIHDIAAAALKRPATFDPAFIPLA